MMKIQKVVIYSLSHLNLSRLSLFIPSLISSLRLKFNLNKLQKITSIVYGKLVVCVVLVGGIMLSGCATLPAKDAELATQVSAEYIAKPSNSWLLIGKISYRDGDAKSSAIANIDWQHIGVGGNRDAEADASEDTDADASSTSSSIRIFNSVGGDIARVEQNGDTSKVKIRGKDLTIPPGDYGLAEAIEQEVGYYVPLEQLRSWIKGEVWPNSDAKIGSAAGDKSRIVSIIQDGWQIDYSNFQQGLARRITAKKDAYIITLAITSWVQAK